MKTTTFKLMMVALVVLLSVNAHAYDVENDGVYYKVIPEANKAEVVGAVRNNTGEFLILASIIHEGITYPVGSIGDGAFSGCRMTSIAIPNSVTSIGKSAFKGCSRLTSIDIPNSVTSIGDYAFSACYGLTSIDIPNSVTSIGDYAFESCDQLISITIPNSVTSIGVDAFYNTTWFSLQAKGLIYINNVAYCYKGTMPSNTSITIMEGTVSISPGAFSYCWGLTSVTIPNSVTSIGGKAFERCSGLTSITIPNSVTSIGDYAFWNCSNLTTVTIPNSVTSIGSGAFSGCI